MKKVFSQSYRVGTIVTHFTYEETEAWKGQVKVPVGGGARLKPSQHDLYSCPIFPKET